MKHRAAAAEKKIIYMAEENALAEENYRMFVSSTIFMNNVM